MITMLLLIVGAILVIAAGVLLAIYISFDHFWKSWKEEDHD